MKYTRILALLVVAVLMISPMAALAQDEPKLEEFVSADEKLTLSYPEGWLAEENGEDVGLPGVQLANSEEALDKLVNGGDMVEGEAGIMVILFPSDFLAFLGLDLPQDFTAEDLAAGFGEVFAAEDTMSVDPEATEEAPTTAVGEPEVVMIGPDEDIEAGFVSITSEDAEGGVIAYEVTEGVVAIVVVAAYPGSFDESVQDSAYQVAGSLNYAGTGEDLLNVLMGVDATAPIEDMMEATAEATEAAE